MPALLSCAAAAVLALRVPVGLPHALVASMTQLVCLVVPHGTLTVQDRATRRLLRL